MRRAWLAVVLVAACSSSGERSGGTDAATEAPVDTYEGPSHDAAPEIAAGHQPADPAGYEYWWFPDCETADGTCPADRCFRNQIEAIPDRCGPYLGLEVGCVPRTTAIAGWFCKMRKSNGELIYTQVSPRGGDWVECTNILSNLPPMQGALCVDAGGD